LKTGNMEGNINKDFFGNIQTPFSLINNKVIIPTTEEIGSNSRARSAKLRIASKK
ncbi:MAG: 16S rRNA (cytosine(1402)-N(4))-methyltransferase, partial [Paludibacteraceae bacterium]|nr:16S rRNA (cytosine(1402)-N(4))-methyltransferase [Paludibacteraceae bacterium]